MTTPPGHRDIALFSDRSSGFTLIELLLVIAIIALLVAIVLPVLSAARDAARSTLCLSQLRQIGIATQSYLNDNNDFYPDRYFDHWYLLGEYLGCDFLPPVPPASTPIMIDTEEVLTCPMDDDPEIYDPGVPHKAQVTVSYGVNYVNFSGINSNGRYRQASLVPNPSEIPFACDANDNLINPFTSPNLDPEPRHTGDTVVNVLFADSSVRSHTFEEMTAPGWNTSDIPPFWR